MKDIRLVALDLDGTVFNDKKEITPRTLAAIRAACARGVAVLPATGRTASGIPAAFTSIPGVRYALTSNGASVVDLTTGEQLVNQPFGTEQASKIYDLLEQGGGMMSIFIGGKSYTTRENAENHMDVVPENLKSYFRTTRIEVDDMHATLRTHAHEIEKYSLIYHDEAERDAAWRAIEAACPGVELSIFDVVFIHIDRCQQAGGNIFQAIIQCGIRFWLLTIAQLNGNFCGSICQQCNRFIHRHSLRTGSNTFNTCKIRILAGNCYFP